MWISSKRKSHGLACITLVLLASSVVAQAQPPDNAALLYYQAFLLYEKPDEATDKVLNQFRHGEMAANEVITRHIEQNRRAIDTVVRAANIDKCDWGYDYSLGVELTMPNLAQVRKLAFLLTTDARWLAGQGDYQTALDRCVTLRKMALHVCDKTLISYLVAIAVDALANGTTEDVLGSAPPNAETLRQFKSDLAQTAGRFPSSATCLAQEAEVCAATMTRDDMQAQIQMAREMADAKVIERLQQGDEAFFQRNREYYFSMIEKLTVALEADLPYARMCATLDDLNEQMRDNPDATLACLALSPASVKRIYQLAIRRQTHFNAVMTAIDLYLAVAQQGQLPATLPANSPPDLFSGKPFAYTRTGAGFTLRCQAQEIPEKDPHEYVFKVSK
ncbi:MAG: hypothetical protein JSW27_02800 [Phycisphaerales bacterium]|nr:MAG: hypothetical protein JSW27_02800 [Phycisphaerales bacterium]